MLKSSRTALSYPAITSQLLAGITEAAASTSKKVINLARGKIAPSRTVNKRIAGASPATVQEDDNNGVGTGAGPDQGEAPFDQNADAINARS